MYLLIVAIVNGTHAQTHIDITCEEQWNECQDKNDYN